MPGGIPGGTPWAIPGGESGVGGGARMGPGPCGGDEDAAAAGGGPVGGGPVGGGPVGGGPAAALPGGGGGFARASSLALSAASCSSHCCGVMLPGIHAWLGLGWGSTCHARGWRCRALQGTAGRCRGCRAPQGAPRSRCCTRRRSARAGAPPPAAAARRPTRMRMPPCCSRGRAHCSPGWVRCRSPLGPPASLHQLLAPATAAPRRYRHMPRPRRHPRVASTGPPPQSATRLSSLERRVPHPSQTAARRAVRSCARSEQAR
jgi:hypothetical protein